MVSDPSTHRLFLVRSLFDPSDPTTTIYQLITVDTTTGALTVSPSLSHQLMTLAFDPSTGSLFGLTGDCCPNQIVRVDPGTGVETHLADVIGDAFSIIALDPSSHSIYLDSDSFATPPPTHQLLTVDTVTGSVSPLPITSGLRSLVFDSGSLFGTTCCPYQFLQVDPATGSETPLGSYDFGFFLEPGTAFDSATHTIFKVQDVFDDPITGPIAHIASINDQTGAGVLGATTGVNLAAIAFEPVQITALSLKADIRHAVASGDIDSAQIAKSLLAKVTAADFARAHGRCGVTAHIYRTFIRQVNAQSGRHITPATATQLAGEAQFLMTRCP
jgi:hypothetical protein